MVTTSRERVPSLGFDMRRDGKQYNIEYVHKVDLDFRDAKELYQATVYTCGEDLSFRSRLFLTLDDAKDFIEDSKDGFAFGMIERCPICYDGDSLYSQDNLSESIVNRPVEDIEEAERCRG